MVSSNQVIVSTCILPVNTSQVNVVEMEGEVKITLRGVDGSYAVSIQATTPPNAARLKEGVVFHSSVS